MDSRYFSNNIDDIITKDITNILFNINSPDNDKDDISIEKIEDAYCLNGCCDDLIITKDNKSMLYAEPYTFQFARENRYPALHWISNTVIVLNCVHAVLTEEDIKNQINPEADDPDEDEIIFTYSPSLPYHLTQSDFDRGYIYLTIYAEEKGNNNKDHRDWQELKLLIICTQLQ